MRPSAALAGAAVAVALVVGGAACGDDDGTDTDTSVPGTESELDGGEAGTGGDTSTTEPAGSPPGDMTTGGTTQGATEGNQVPPAG